MHLGAFIVGKYAHIQKAFVDVEQLKWARIDVGAEGQPRSHGHSFWRDGDEKRTASVEVTTDKARTAAIYRRESKVFEDQASGGRPSALHLARAVPLQGGVPIELDGHVIGAVGVSGATSADEDAELARMGARAIQDALVVA